MSRFSLSKQALLLRMNFLNPKKLNRETKVHLVGWGIFSTYFILLFGLTYGFNKISFLQIPYLLADAFIFYAFHFYVFDNIKIGKIAKATLWIAIGIIGFYTLIVLRTYLGKVLYPFEHVPHGIKFYLVRYSWDVILGITASFAVYYYEENLRVEKEKRRIQKRYYDNEINYLKGQINQHFLYNLFGFFYAKARESSIPLGDAILDLSDLFRYSVNKKFVELSPLSDEWENVLTFIRLNDYRFDSKIKKDIKLNGKLSKIHLPHLLVLTLVENAYKHGDLLNYPLQIWLSIEEDKMIFKMKNRCHKAVISRRKGIGLDNIEKRLTLLGFTYNFSHYREIDDYYTNLTLNNLTEEYKPIK